MLKWGLWTHHLSSGDDLDFLLLKIRSEFIGRYLFLEISRNVVFMSQVAHRTVNNDHGPRKRKSWPRYPLSKYLLATPEAMEHWPLPPEATLSSDDSRWVPRLSRMRNDWCPTGRLSSLRGLDVRGCQMTSFLCLIHNPVCSLSCIFQ